VPAAQLRRDGDRVRLIARGGYDWSKRFPWIVEAALKNRQHSAMERVMEPSKPETSDAASSMPSPRSN
jgi:hypothetical protein